jgi:D-arabinose 1-dehydrogenase-like Zn-dependent alcohol dehydrogenase
LKAAVYRDQHRSRSEDVNEPGVSEREALVKFKAGGICGTDMHFQRGDWRWMKRGLIIGHDAWK